jgi:hypothetical protein
VRQIPFAVDGEESRETAYYLIARRSTVRETVDKFMNGGRLPSAPDPAVDGGDESPAGGKPARKRRERFSINDVPGLEDARREGEDQAVIVNPKLDFPMYFPTRKLAGSRLDGGLSSDPTTRTYTIRDEDGKRQRAYRMTFRRDGEGFSKYYGVQGTTWRDPPILDAPDETRRIRGRTLQVHYDGRKVRLIGWKTSKGAYWVTNTLMQELSNRQMLAVAASLTRLRGA